MVQKKRILVAKEVALKLRVDVQRVYHLTRLNALPGIIKLGDRQYRYCALALEKFLHGIENSTDTEVENHDR